MRAADCLREHCESFVGASGTAEREIRAALGAGHDFSVMARIDGKYDSRRRRRNCRMWSRVWPSEIIYLDFSTGIAAAVIRVP